MSADHKSVVFYGASDDLIEVEGEIPGCDEYGAESGIFEIAGLVIEVDFLTSGCWGIRVSQIDEDVPVTATDIRLAADRYSMRLTLLVPPGSHVTAKVARA